MLSNTEIKLMERVMNSSIEFKMKAYKALGKELSDIQKQLNELLGHVDTKAVPVVEEAKTATVEKIEEKKAESKPQPINKKVSDIKKLINCGPSEGEDKVLFIEKRRDSKHLWIGQIRISNYVRNFHWSNELSMPIIYGIDNYESLVKASALIKNSVKEIKPDELTLYDAVPDHPEFGNFSGRFCYDLLDEGCYIYMTPEANVQEGKSDDIIYKGYVDDHAFIVNRDRNIYWRKYDYINSKKPFEVNPSKGYDINSMVAKISKLVELVDQKFISAVDAFNNKGPRVDAATDTTISNDIEDISGEDIQGIF